MALHIGIVACSAEGAALCCRTICLEGAKRLGPFAHPQVSLHGHSFASYLAAIERDNWTGVGELMLSSARKLALAGAELLVCPDNTIHRAMPHVRTHSTLPWLHIAEVVAARAAERGFKKVGLTGTRWLVEGGVYPEALEARGIGWVRPAEPDRIEVSRIIMEELVVGVVRPASVASLQAVIARLAASGCDAVALGCTELPLVLSDANSPLPVLDSTRLLAAAAVQRAVEGEG